MNKLCCILFVFLVGCTRIIVQGNGDSPDVKKNIWGISHITFDQNTKVGYYQVKTIGFGSSNKHFSVGYSKISQLTIKDPSVCSIIMFVKTKAELEKIENYFKNTKEELTKICLYLGE